MIAWLVACVHDGTHGWGVVQHDHHGLATRIAHAPVAPGDSVVAWEWPDTRVWTASVAAPDAPPPLRQSTLRPVHLQVVSVDGDVVRFRAAADLDVHATLVTRLRAGERVAPVGARQQLFRGFVLRCAELGVEPLGGEADAACTRLPLGNELLLATEWTTGPGATCVASALEGADGTRRPFRELCR